MKTSIFFYYDTAVDQFDGQKVYLYARCRDHELSMTSVSQDVYEVALVMES